MEGRRQDPRLGLSWTGFFGLAASGLAPTKERVELNTNGLGVEGEEATEGEGEKAGEGETGGVNGLSLGSVEGEDLFLSLVGIGEAALFTLRGPVYEGIPLARKAR